MSFPSLLEIVFALVLFGAGVLLLSLLVALIGLLPAIVAAIIVYLLMGSLILGAITFVVVAFLWAIVKHH